MCDSKLNYIIVTLYLKVKDVLKYPFFILSGDDSEVQKNLVSFQRAEGKTDFILKGQIKEDVVNGLNEFIENKDPDELINFTMACSPDDPALSKFMFWNEKSCSTHNPSFFTNDTDPLNMCILMFLEDPCSNLESLNDFNTEDPEELTLANLSLENVVKRLKWIKKQVKKTEPDLSFKNGRPLVLLSGGLDSTYLAFSLLQKTDIDVLYVKGRQSPLKIEAELQALENIYSYFKEFCPYRIINIFVSDVSHYYFDDSNIKFAQPSIWLFAAVNVIRKSHSSLQMAYVLGDQITRYIDRISATWDNLISFTRHSDQKVEFPLLESDKETIINNIPGELRKLTWTCELPRKLKNGKFKECNHCPACIGKQFYVFLSKKKYGNSRKVKKF